MVATLVLEALNRALGHRQIEPEQLLTHTDQGSPYRANAKRQLLEIHKITPSMSAKGCCWDNAVAESFFSTLCLFGDSPGLFPSSAAAFYGPNSWPWLNHASQKQAAGGRSLQHSIAGC